MRNRLIFIVSALGAVLGLFSAFVFGQQNQALPPAYNPAANPYPSGIYANGIVESEQSTGENINIYPEVTGPIVRIAASEGQHVRKGDILIAIDDSVQRLTAEQQKAAFEASLAQIVNAEAVLKSARDTLAKDEKSFALDPKSVSRDVLDTQRNAVKIAETNVEVVKRQSVTLDRSYAAAAALLAKYTIRAPVDGVVLSVEAAQGSYVSPQGAYDSYTQAMQPLIVMGTAPKSLEVRTYIDEILVPRLENARHIDAVMFIRGTDRRIPLSFVRIQPYVSPKIELSDEREERVDVRVLPVIFRFEKPANLSLYPGQLVDVYVSPRS